MPLKSLNIFFRLAIKIYIYCPRKIKRVSERKRERVGEGERPTVFQYASSFHPIPLLQIIYFLCCHAAWPECLLVCGWLFACLCFNLILSSIYTASTSYATARKGLLYALCVEIFTPLFIFQREREEIKRKAFPGCCSFYSFPLVHDCLLCYPPPPSSALLFVLCSHSL